MKTNRSLLAIAFLGGVALAAIGGGLALHASDVRAQDDAFVLTDADKALLKVVPGAPGAEDPPLVPHATPDEAKTIAAAFFAEPWPTDAELDAIRPFERAGNVAQAECSSHEPPVAKQELILAPGNIERKLKGEIYGLIKLRQVLATKDCTCTGKIAAYEPVPLIFDEIIKRNKPLTWILVDRYRDENLRLLKSVERACQGNFF